MRLAYLSVSDQLGGSEVVLLQLLDEIRRRRPTWQPHVILPGNGPLRARAADAGAAVHVVEMPPALARLGEPRSRPMSLVRHLSAAAAVLPSYERRVGETIRRLAPDVLHSNGFKAHVISSRLVSPAARLWHVHEYVSSRPLTRRLLRHYAPTCDGCVAVSRSIGDDATRALQGRLRTPVRVVPNGVDVQRFCPEGQKADLDALAGLPQAAAGTVRIGLVGTFARWKGHEVFLRAIADLPRALPVRAYVIGGPLYDTSHSQYSLDELRALATAHGCGDRVGFTGFVHDAPAVMRALDVVVHASTRPEPFGLVLVEAMACARAIVSSAAGGAAEIVEAERTALLHVAGDRTSLRVAIERLVNDPVLRAGMGAVARAAAVQSHGASAFGEGFIEVYEGMATTCT